MFCAISGTSPVNPVVSKISGHVYERDLILKALKDNDGKDPVTGDTLTEEDLVVVKTVPSAPSAPPRPPTHSSIPALLHTLQNEWDATMLEVLDLRRSSTKLRQELSHALYKEDAAMRVLGRVMKERDEARAALASVQSSLGVSAQPAASGGDGMDVDDKTAAGGDEGGLTGPALQIVNSTLESLSATRRKRKTPPGHATVEDIRALTQTATVPSLHSTKPPGIASLDVARDGNLILTGGVDKTVLVYDRTTEKQVAALKGHTKKVHAALFAGPLAEGDELPSLIVTASADKTVRVYKSGAAKTVYGALGQPITVHSNEVTSLALHPSRQIVASGSLDSSFALHDLSSPDGPVTLRTVTVPAASPDSGALAVAGLTSLAFHPDGALLGVGAGDSHIRVFDIRSADAPTTLPGHSAQGGGTITSLSFSENGYLLASACANAAAGGVQIWDLRKLNNTKTLPVLADTKVNVVAWDYTGQYLAVAGSSLHVYQNKTWDELLAFDGNVAELTGLIWTQASRQIVVAGMDRTVRCIGMAA